MVYVEADFVYGEAMLLGYFMECQLAYGFYSRVDKYLMAIFGDERYAQFQSAQTRAVANQILTHVLPPYCH